MTLAIRLDPKLEKRLTRLANETHRTKTYYVSKALEIYLDDREDYELAAARLSDPKARYVSMEEVIRELGLEHKVGGKGKKATGKAKSSRSARHRRVSEHPDSPRL